jgi:hypothetical protein
MTRRYNRDVSRPRLHLAPFFHDHAHPARDLIEEVWRLAEVSPGNRLDVLRPAPAGLEGRPAHSTPPMPTISICPCWNGLTSSGDCMLFSSPSGIASSFSLWCGRSEQQRHEFRFAADPAGCLFSMMLSSAPICARHDRGDCTKLRGCRRRSGLAGHARTARRPVCPLSRPSRGLS